VLKIGLTGGIGCGKSTVSAIFAELAVPVIDADTISHDLVAPGRPALVLIQDVFGADVITSDGTLDRAKLRGIVFADPQAKKNLEAILHPLIYQAIQTQLEQLHSAYCLIVIPLLFETNMTHWVDRILVVDCPVEQQIARVVGRDKLTVEQVQAIINSQVPRSVRLADADDVIANMQITDNLAEQVKKLHNLYISLSHHYYQD